VAILLSDEFRLAYFLLLAAAIFIGAWRFISRRLMTDWADRAADILLLAFLVQYLSVTLPGLVGILNPRSIALTTIALSAALFFAPIRTTQPPPTIKPGKSNPLALTIIPFNWPLLAATLFGLGYLLAIAWEQRYMPVTANDAITYHFPTAAQWLRTGHLSLFETWFFNPANTFSPLAGSTFITWWIAPLGNDILARHEQLPALLLVFFAALRLMRAIGVHTTVAALIALALILSRPFLHQVEVEKDDLYLTAFFACAAAAFTKDRLQDPLAPWRIGVALGLLLATKFTALLALPALLLVIDAPFRARWCARRYVIALGLILLLAGPWYLRNLLLTGNPIFPIETKLFPGLMSTTRSVKFHTLSSIWTLLTNREHDQSLPIAPMLVLLIGLLTAFAARFRQLRADPIIRLCLLGPPLALTIYLTFSPYPELRFLDPAFLLLFAASALAVAWIRPRILQIIAAAVLLIPCWATAYILDEQRIPVILGLVMFASFLTAIGLGITWLLRQFPAHHPTIFKYAPLAITLAIAAQIYMEWEAYAQTCRNSAFIFYPIQYGQSGEVWKFIREEIPPAETLAYTNTFLIHPMDGFKHDRPLIYIPTRKNITHIQNLPPFQTKLSGEQIVPAMAAAMTSDTDGDGWLKKLFASRATHLVIFAHDVIPNPPEQTIVKTHPEKFEQVFQNPAATVYRLKK